MINWLYGFVVNECMSLFPFGWSEKDVTMIIFWYATILIIFGNSFGFLGQVFDISKIIFSSTNVCIQATCIYILKLDIEFYSNENAYL